MSVKYYSTQMCELATFKMVTYSDIPLMETIYIQFLYFPIRDFLSLKYAVILFFISIT